ARRLANRGRRAYRGAGPGLADGERPVHQRGMRVAQVRVLALLQRDSPRRRALAGDRGLLVDPRPLEVKVVELGRVCDDDHVLAGLELRDLLAALRERDLEARVRADMPDELRRRSRGATGCDERRDTGGED